MVASRLLILIRPIHLRTKLWLFQRLHQTFSQAPVSRFAREDFRVLQWIRRLWGARHVETCILFSKPTPMGRVQIYQTYFSRALQTAVSIGALHAVLTRHPL